MLCRALHFSGGEHPCSIAEIFHYQKPRRQCDQIILESLQTFLLYFSSDGKKENHKGEGDTQRPLRRAPQCTAAPLFLTENLQYSHITSFPEK